MVSEKADIREFVFRELRHCSDLSTLTLGILRRRYLEHVGRESLSVEHKQLLKQIVEEELLKMQANGSDASLVISAEPSQKRNKRKREDKYEAQTEDTNEDDVVGRKKKARFESVLPDSPDSGIEKAVHEEALKDDGDDGGDKDEHDGESDEELTEKMEMKKEARHAVRGNRKGRLSSESEEGKKSVRKGKAVGRKEEELDSFEDSGKDDENQGRTKSRGQRKTKRASSDSEGRARRKQAGKSRARRSEKQESVGEPDSPESEAVRRVQKEVFGSSSESEEEREGTKAQGRESGGGAREDETNQKKGSAKASSDEELEGKGETRDEGKSDSESDSSSLPSSEEEELSKKHKQEEKKSGSKRRNSDESDGKARGGKLDEENKAVSRLKRYIALCGVRRNYKKLLAGCRSVKAKVAVLKKELEELGVEGQPSIEKCKKARMKREEAQELAELDVGNIITTQGRSRRRAAGLWPLPRGPSSSPPSAFKRAVNSDSDSENDSADRGRKRATDWSNLKGIISDDADSD